jgi:hypothetical protein
MTTMILIGTEYSETTHTVLGASVQNPNLIDHTGQASVAYAKREYP